MRKVRVESTSLPEAPLDQPLSIVPGRTWQVLCGDPGHWRVGIYSPALTSADECGELEQHTCPEFFLLLSGKLTLVLREDGVTREVPLEADRPMLVSAPHSGFCPQGPHTGVAVVVERDAFETLYRTAGDWAGR